jgi:ABC-type transport system substrate-binding protein
MNHAVNRDRRMKVSSGVMVHAEGIIPPVLHGYDPNFKGYDFDPKKARELLRESGVPLPIHTVLWHSTEEGVRTMAQGVQADLKDVGVELDLKMVSYGELITAAETRGKVPMLYSGWSCVIPDPVDMLGTQFDGRAVTNSTTMNMSFYNNPAVTKLLDEGAATGDLPRRFEIYRRAERMIMDDAPWVVLSYLQVNSLRQPWLKGKLLEPFWPFRFDRIWLEK